MITRAIEATFTPIRDEIKGKHETLLSYGVILDTLTARINEREKAEGNFVELTIKGNIVGLRKDVEELNSTYISMLWNDVTIPKGHVTEIHPATVIDGVETIVGADYETSETDEEELGVAVEQVDDDKNDDLHFELEDLEEVMVQVSIEVSICDTSTIWSSGSKPTEEPVVSPLHIIVHPSNDA